MRINRLIKQLERKFIYVMPNEKREARLVINYLKELRDIKKQRENDFWEKV